MTSVPPLWDAPLVAQASSGDLLFLPHALPSPPPPPPPSPPSLFLLLAACRVFSTGCKAQGHWASGSLRVIARQRGPLEFLSVFCCFDTEEPSPCCSCLVYGMGEGVVTQDGSPARLCLAGHQAASLWVLGQVTGDQAAGGLGRMRALGTPTLARNRSVAFPKQQPAHR